MEPITGVLTKSVAGQLKSSTDNRQEIPPRGRCGCGLLTNWFWLISDCEKPSQWLKHLCVCQVLRLVNQKIIEMITQKDVLNRELENNGYTKKYVKGKEAKMTGMLQELGLAIQNKQGLLAKLRRLSKLADPNTEYLKTRLELARDHNAWRELFDCEDENETLSVLNSLYADGSDRFALSMAQLTLQGV